MNAALLAARLVLAAVFCASGIAYAYAGTPSAVAVSADGRIASQVAAGADGVRALVTALLTRIATGDPS